MKTKYGIFLALVVAGAVGLCLLVVFGIGAEQVMGAGNIRQGLDLRGGVSILYEADQAAPSSEDMNAAVSRLRRRLDSRGYMEADVATQGARQIRVDIPGVDDAEQAVAEIGATAVLTFEDEEGNIILTGTDVARAQKGIQTNQAGASEVVVNLEFTSYGAARFEEATRNNIGRTIRIYLDDDLISAPTVNTVINEGRCYISGNFTAESAEYLATLIRDGSLPFRLIVISMNNVGARLGADALETSIIAGIIGAALVLLFMLFIYRLSGLCADLALIIYTALLLLLLSSLRITLTLPGIAGIILSVGMAVDANVVIFERIREEMASGRTLRASLDAGYKRALPAIIDSNITTLIVAGVLFWLGTGPVKGFAQTLAIGVLVSMFTAIFVTRFITTCFINLNVGKGDPKMYGAVLKDKKDPDAPRKFLPIAENRVKFFIFSACLLAVGVIVMTVNGIGGRGMLNYDVEFSGGTSFTIDIGQPFDNSEIEAIVRDVTGQSSPQVQKVLNTNQVMLKIQSIAPETRIALIEAISARYGLTRDAFNYADVSPTVSADMQRSAVLAVIVACFFMLVYITWRFRDIRMGGSTILALLHDAMVVIFAFAIFRIPLNYAFIAVILTSLGYSINASIILFDRVRENRIRMRNTNAGELINGSVTQTLRRSIYTTLSTLMVVAALYIMGVASIKDFTLPIIIGLFFGFYSTTCLAGSFWFMMGKGKKGA
jgi:SecD/SecF fusion protein